ncbi:MAG: UDP-glucose/GDP-mannose dehydrogenase family protein [Nevskia sp.]|jgi:GDP-mannose 6-dehydrogenase|nr:UDP-glucose/GDP-mannose dehydrogenase family protein [Nevskia sp.]
MHVSIFGMGYVGAVCAACLADRGHQVIGVDISQFKVDLINQGRSPIVEPGLEALLTKGVASGLLRATRDTVDAIINSQLTMICVGTPSKKSGDLDLSYIEAVAREIGAVIRHKRDRHTVVVRSTVLPGTVHNIVVPILEAESGKRAGIDFGVAVNPEFLRESTAIRDYNAPPMTVIGEWDSRSGDLLALLYAELDAPIIRKPIEVAEMVKYSCNVWHATKVAFANEIGNIAKAVGVDGRQVMEVVCEDTTLNLSNYYMRPGFAFGGSCLPKDVRALTYRALQLDAPIPLISSLMRSNQAQVRKAFDLVESFGERRIGMLGLSFKSKTDDLRESPLVELAEMLIGKGYDLSIFDQNIQYARVHGANRDYINVKIPHISSLLKTDIEEVIDCSDVLVLGLRDRSFEKAINGGRHGRKVVDLVGYMPHVSTEEMQGICW